MNIGLNILSFRKEFNARTISKKLDVPTAAISKWETNAAYPDYHNATKTCNNL